MGWKELSHADGCVLVEFADGSRLNIRYDHLIEQNDPARPKPVRTVALGPRIVASRYHFEPGNVLGAHSHEATTLHDILVEKGTVLVKKTSGDVQAVAGDRILLKVEETHSITALTDAVTLHTLVNDAADPA